MKNINEAVSFEEVAQIRQEIYLANRAGNNNFEDILYGLYKDDTHFIYELIQNADDVFATEVGFELRPNELVFYHNGTKDFELKNVIGITGIGASTKVDELNKIGKFGIGFKSVFSITETPRVFSGEFNFEIRNFTVPYRIEPLVKNTGTKFILPFKYPAVEVFDQGSALVELDGYWGIINKKGRTYFPFSITEYKGFRTTKLQPRTLAKKDNYWGIIDGKGKIIIPFIYTLWEDYQERGTVRMYKEDGSFITWNIREDKRVE